VNVAQLEQDLRDQLEDGPFTLTMAAVWMRYAYVNGYVNGLSEPEPDLEAARKLELRPR